MHIRNKSDQAREVDLPASDTEPARTVVVEPGETIEVPDDVAKGSPATGKDPTADGWHPGTSGLLAQDDLWEKSTARKAASEEDDK